MGVVVRMTDVAREAGVSAMTVSNVVNGRPGASEGTRRRVLAAIERLGYEVDPAARQLRSGRTGVLGLLVPELDAPYFTHLAARLSALAAADGLRVALERTGSGRAVEAEALNAARLRHYDGVVVAPVELDAADVPAEGPPIVFLGERPLPGVVDQVRMDNVNGARLAAAHLIAAGARRIAVIGGSDAAGAEDLASLRTRGLLDAHAEARLHPDPRLLVRLPSFERRDGYQAVLRLHEAGAPFDAVFAFTDAAATGALRALADLGIDVPGDVQVMGFDDDPEDEYLVPRLSSVDPGNDAIAAAVLARLRARIAGTPPAESELLAPRASVIARESTRTPVRS